MFNYIRKKLTRRPKEEYPGRMFSRKKYTISHDLPNESAEDVALRQFKGAVKDLLKPEYDDYYLTKWLKARNWDVLKAVDMFRNSMEFRKKMGSDTILEIYKPPEVIQKYLTGGFCGFDKDGSPVRVELFGHLDIKGLMYSAKTVDMEKTKVKQCETTVRDWEEQSKKLGRRVDGLTVIFDMEGVGTSMLWKPGLQMYLHLVTMLEDNYPEMVKRMFVINGLNMYLHLVKILEDNYPEMMKRLIVINAPSIFPLLYKLCRPLISEDMKKKIFVLGSNYTSTLLQHIDEDQLPAYLGGKLTDPDGNPRCATMICQGGPVPESYFLKNSALTENLTSVNVSKKLELEYNVEKAGVLLRWEFFTEGYDIGFGVFMKNGDGSLKEVIPVERVNCHMVPEDGSITCKEPGTYVICFDNSFSWARTKKLSYAVEILQEDKDILSEVRDIGYKQ